MEGDGMRQMFWRMTLLSLITGVHFAPLDYKASY